MNRSRAVSVALALAAAAMLATGSLGYTSVSADRGVQIEVVDHENAYVNATACEVSRGNGQEPTPVRVWVTNQYSGEFAVERIASGTDELSKAEVLATLEPGESERFESLKADGEVTVHVTGSLNAAVTVDVAGKDACQSGASTGNENGGSPEATTDRGQRGPPETTVGNETTTAPDETTTPS